MTVHPVTDHLSDAIPPDADLGMGTERPMRIWAWQADQGGCGFYRVADPMRAMLRYGGHKVQITPQVQGFVEHRMLGHGELCLIQRVVFLDMVPAVRRLATPDRKLVYELDDNMFAVDPRNVNAFKLYARPEVIDGLRSAASICDLITVTTPDLAVEMERQCGVPTVVLPNLVDDEMFTIERPRSDRVTVGWAGGQGHDSDMRTVAKHIRRFLARNPHVDFHVIGYDYRRMLGEERIRHSQWQNPITAYWRSLDFDIGIAPLAHNIFNRGKCVDSSMRVSTDSGVHRAGELQPGMRVWRNGWRTVEAVERSAPRLGLLITLGDGYQLRLTPEHRMLCGGQWARADKLTVGDVLTMEAESVGPTIPVRAPWPADSRMSRAGRFGSGRNDDPFDPEAFLTAEDGPRVEITPRWGRLLGAYVGDGSVGQSTKVTIACDGQDQDWIDQVMIDFSACGLNPRTEKIVTFDGTVLRRRAVTVASAHLLRVLASWGLTRSRESGKPIRVPCVPEVIWRSPREVIAEFLAGYFEADGSLTSAGCEVTSKDEQLIRDVQRLLLLFGITSRVSARKGAAQNGFTGVYWKCTLRRAEADVFAKEIGFRSERKRARLSVITGRPHSNRYTPMRWSREIASIESCEVDPVDIQVEGSTFVLAGFVSHNSGLKALEYGALGIPTVATDAAPYRDVIVDGVTGFLVTQDHEWERRLRDLANDEAMRTEMGAAARRHIMAHHSLSRHWRRWEATYARLLGLPHRSPELAPEPITTGSTPYLLRRDRRVLIG